ncbi:ABC transporter-related protein [Chthoniobacter flavus Ellin428]|uniref:UvrABC system protein A n=1 Tax=Chthoniobacter flavus Ellin428 TaxID=497964 RepID=B4CXL9_9BACT|nr:ATP-binding cassette domain-containing protein [Chthoniobacter flavus]EDY21017.1 ABC transporter-related protein [Chthoniobacter flavus Ellin428]TCO88742.1 excinuclease UvrABC ATPase subunit [Chthoniobacter flavus]
MRPPSTDQLSVTGVRLHNLKSVSVSIPHFRHTVCTGVSGCGKSSLVFDCIYALCEYELLQSLSTYARGAIPLPVVPDVEHASGLLPPVVIDQADLGRNPRSTIGTSTEAYTFLRLLFARAAVPVLDASAFSFNSPEGACPACRGLGQILTPDPERLFDLSKSLGEGAIRHRAWKVGGRYWNIIKATEFFEMDAPLGQWPKEKLDHLMHAAPAEVANRVPGFVQRFTFEGVVERLRERLADDRGLDSADYDAQFFTTQWCATCGGTRLQQRALACRLNGLNIADAAGLAVPELKNFVRSLEMSTLATVVDSLSRILENLEMVELSYLTLDRPITTVSGGEMQRIKIARELGSRLMGILYILDEPSRGLHAKNVEAVNSIITKLKERGNTILSVEHNRAVVELADNIVELGPGAGSRGGQITETGTPADFKNSSGPTGRLLSAAKQHISPPPPKAFTEWHFFSDLRRNNLKIEKLKIPRAALTCLVGVSGAGKSSLLEEMQLRDPASVRVAQRQIGASVRSNVCTYLNFFDEIRNLFAKKANASASLFAFNSDGACPECGGRGSITLDLHFLGSAMAPCRTCNGKRYRAEVLGYTWQDRNISEVLELPVEEAATFFREGKKIRSALELLLGCGLGYIRLGQSLDTFSGGELQRVKLIYGLNDPTALYLLDEPSRGLHPDDIERIVSLLRTLTARGKTVVASEHSLDLVARADWVVELGPGAANAGGKVIAAGTVREIIRATTSITAQYLKSYVRPGT